MSPPTLRRVGELLWHGARTRETGTGRFGLPWEHRASPAAGGLQSIRIFVLVSDSQHVHAYDALRHCLLVLPDSFAAATIFKEKVREMLPDANGAHLLFMADRHLLQSAYENAESLAWRDAGCALATIHMCAEWLGLALCPIGLLGHEVISSADPDNALIAAGACVFGEPVT